MKNEISNNEIQGVPDYSRANISLSSPLLMKQKQKLSLKIYPYDKNTQLVIVNYAP